MPGEIFRYDIGEFKCTIINDGTIVNPDADDKEEYGINCLLIDSGEHRILIDAGCGDGFQTSAGRLVNNLTAAGTKCSEIDRIIITHGHIDHVAGCFDSQGNPVFPDTHYITTNDEWEYWESPPGENQMQNMFFDITRRNLVPARSRFELADGGDEILPGIKLIEAPGHTPGNSMVELSSGESRLLCIGDIMHSLKEFVRPDYLIAFDVAPEQAMASRARLLPEIERSGVLVFSYHFPFPGLGHIARDDGAFAWQPIRSNR